MMYMILHLTSEEDPVLGLAFLAGALVAATVLPWLAARLWRAGSR